MFLFRLCPGEYAFNAAVHLLKPPNLAPEYASQPFVIAADEEELFVLNDMGKIIVGSVTHISEIYGGGSIAPGSIHHPAESDIFVPLPGRLDHKVGEAPVQYGIEGIDMDLVEALCRFAIRFKKRVDVIRVVEDVGSGPVTGNELVFPVVEVLLQPAVKCVEKVSEGIASKLAALPVKSGFGWDIRGAAEITVKFLFDTVSLHCEEHHQGVMEPHFPVPGKSLTGLMAYFSGSAGISLTAARSKALMTS